MTARPGTTASSARCWAEFNTDGPEIDYFRQLRRGGPARRSTSAAAPAGSCCPTCATASTSTAATSPRTCSRSAARPPSGRGSSPNLYAQPMHELDLPAAVPNRSSCAALSGSAAPAREDVEAFAARLLPPRARRDVRPRQRGAVRGAARPWQYWLRDERADAAAPREPAARVDAPARLGRDRVRAPLRLARLRSARAAGDAGDARSMWRDGELVAEDEHVPTMTLYFKDEVVLMLERAGFVDVRCGRHYGCGADRCRRLPRLPSAQAGSATLRGWTRMRRTASPSA